MDQNRLKILLQIVASAAVLGGILWLVNRPPDVAELSLHGSVSYPNGTTIEVEIADTPESRERGLSFRRSLPEGRGILFVLPEISRPIFWMKNMKFPIDILWLREDVIVDVIKEAPPYGDLPPIRYLPEADADMVLEIPAGAFDRNKLKLGDHLDIQLPEGYTLPINS